MKIGPQIERNGNGFFQEMELNSRKYGKFGLDLVDSMRNTHIIYSSYGIITSTKVSESQSGY